MLFGFFAFTDEPQSKALNADDTDNADCHGFLCEIVQNCFIRVNPRLPRYPCSKLSIQKMFAFLARIQLLKD